MVEFLGWGKRCEVFFPFWSAIRGGERGGRMSANLASKKRGISTFRGCGPSRPLFSPNCASAKNSTRENGGRRAKERLTQNALRGKNLKLLKKKKKKLTRWGRRDDGRDLGGRASASAAAATASAAAILHVAARGPPPPHLPLDVDLAAEAARAPVAVPQGALALVEPPWQAGQSPRTCLPGVYCLSAIFFSSKRSRTVGLSPLPSREARAESEREEEDDEGGGAVAVVAVEEGEPTAAPLLICCWTRSGRSVASARGAGARFCCGAVVVAAAGARGEENCDDEDDEAESGAFRRCCCC